MNHLILYSEILALITGLVMMKRLKPPYLKLLVLALALIVCTETVAWACKSFFTTKTLVPRLYNIMLPLQFLLYFFTFARAEQSGTWKKILTALIVCYAMFACVKLFFFGYSGFDTLMYSISVILVSVFCLRYIYMLLLGERVLYIWGDMLFYAAGGILLFYLGTLPFHAMRNYLAENHENIFYTYYYVFIVLGCLMYLLFVFGFYKAASHHKKR